MNTEFQPDMFRNVFYWQSGRLAHTEYKQAITLVDVFKVRKAVSREGREKSSDKIYGTYRVCNIN